MLVLVVLVALLAFILNVFCMYTMIFNLFSIVKCNFLNTSLSLQIALTLGLVSYLCWGPDFRILTPCMCRFNHETCSSSFKAFTAKFISLIAWYLSWKPGFGTHSANSGSLAGTLKEQYLGGRIRVEIDV